MADNPSPPPPVERLSDAELSELERRLRAEVPYQGKSAVAFLCHEAADVLEALARRLTEVEAERDRLRLALIAAGTEAGAFLSTEVSTEFLLKVPGEIRLVMARLASERDAERQRADALLAERVRVLEDGLRHLLAAVTFNEPPRDFGTRDDPNPCWEARVPVGFTDVARAALQQEAGAARVSG
jgi:hypothetical protein